MSGQTQKHEFWEILSELAKEYLLEVKTSLSDINSTLLRLGKDHRETVNLTTDGNQDAALGQIIMN